MTNGFDDERTGGDSTRLWLRYRCQGAEYLPPEYYSALLKPYIFDGCSDVELFRRFLSRLQLKNHPRVLEIGPGTGRATSVLLESVEPVQLNLLDQSHRMLKFLDNFIPSRVNTSYLVNDAIKFCATTDESFDLIYSLWSISHSIHQFLYRSGLESGARTVVNALQRLLTTSLAPGGYLYLLHFDSTSHEQEIALRQRSKIFTFLRPGETSPSQLMIEQVLRDAALHGQVAFEKTHYVGAPIVYANLEEAMEIFMNFHMEGYFNDSPQVTKVIAELERDLKTHEMNDGRISITPACTVYVCQKPAR